MPSISSLSLSRKATILLAAVISITLFGIPLQAQTGSTGGFSGTVRDATGAVLPGTTVTVSHVATGAQRSAVSDDGGRYLLPLLPLGEYELEVSLSGFQSEVRTDLVLTVGKTQVVNFTLRVGEITESVTVQGAAALVETTSSSVSSLVGVDEIRDLPLNGRSFDQLITLSAGTTHFRNRPKNAARGTAEMFTAGGMRPNTTKLMVDGSEYAGATIINSNVSTASGHLLGVDGIQEFSVLTNNGDASFGKKPGGQVNIVTKSGGNRFHGTVFEFVRNDVFDARNFFDAADIPSLRRHNYGFSLGGPIVKDKTFFFSNFERLTETRGVTLRAVVPTLEVRQGIFPDGTVIPVNPAVEPILDLFPLPTGRDFGDGTAETINARTNEVRQRFFVARVDHNFSDTDTLFGRYWIDTGDRLVFNDNNLGQFQELNPFRTQLVTLGYKKVFSPQLLNQATVGFNRGRLAIDFVIREGLTLPPEMILVPGETKQGGIRVGVASGGASSQLPGLGGSGSVGTADRFVNRNVFSYSDQVNYNTGAHFFQMGVDVQRIQSNEFQGTQKRGFLQFPSLERLIEGRPNRIRGPLPGSDATKGWRQTYFGIYAQDRFQLTPTFTLNLGLRWDFLSNPIEVNGKMSSFVPEDSQLTGIYPDTPTIVDKVFAENNSGNFGPRIGFAWDVSGTGRTSIRGGFGVFFAQLENEFRRTLGAAAPFWNRVSVRNPPFPDPGQVLASGSLGRLTPIGLHQSPDIPTIIQWNLRIEQEIAPQTVVSVAYAGARGSHLLRTGNPQIGPPFVDANGRLAIEQQVQNPNLSASGNFLVWDANSFYNSLQVEVQKHLSQGLRFKSAFTWSKAIDDGVEGTLSPSGADDSVLVLSDHRFDRSPPPHHVGRVLVVNWSYDLPLGRHTGTRGILGNDWQLQGILQISDGSPLTPLTGFARSFSPGGTTSDRPDLVPGRDNNPVLGGADQYFDPTAFELQPEGTLGTLANGTISGPGFATLDFSVFKTFAITEEVKLQFRSEFFNLLNRANFAMPDNNLFQPSENRRGAAGRIQSTVSTSREIQFALKLIF